MAIATKQPFRYLNCCILNINWTVGIKFCWNFYQNGNQFLYQENAFENVMKTVRIMRRYSHSAPKAKSLTYMYLNLCLSFFLFVSSVWKGIPWIITRYDTLVQSRPGCTGNGNCHLGRKLAMICARRRGDLDLRSLALKKQSRPWLWKNIQRPQISLYICPIGLQIHQASQQQCSRVACTL